MSYEPNQSEFPDDSGDPQMDRCNSESDNSPGPSQSADHSSGKTSIPGEVMLKCSYCSNAFVRSQSSHMPFCSKRCQQIDLGMWLNESYGFPQEGESAPDNYGDSGEDDE